MRILSANKFFYPKGGSEAVVFHTRQMLLERGHEIIDFAMADPANRPSPYASFFPPSRSYAGMSTGLRERAVDAALSIYSPVARSNMRRLLDTVRPDVAHLHNVYYQLTCSIVDELYARDVPMVLTLHDPHMGCPAHVLYRSGIECRECVTGLALGAVRHRCVKGSLAASTIGAAEAALNRLARKYHKINRFICPSEHMAGVARAAGIPASRVDVIPNFLPESEASLPVGSLASDARFLFAGQLEEHKGVLDLLEAFRTAPLFDACLVVAGSGALEAEVRAAAARDPRIVYAGVLDRREVAAELRRSRAAVLPSRWPENNPMSVLEARAAGVPVIVSDRGGLPEMVSDELDGLVHTGGDVTSLRESLKRLAADLDLATRLGRSGHARLGRENTPGRHYELLMHSYEAARAGARSPLS